MQGSNSKPHNDRSIDSHAQSNSTASDRLTYNTTTIIDSPLVLSPSSPSSSHNSSHANFDAFVSSTTNSNTCERAGHTLVQSNNPLVPSSDQLAQSNSLDHSIPSPPAIALALVPVRQSPLLSAAASSTFGTPTLAHMATQALHNKHKVPYYSSYPRSHSNNNNNQHNNNNNNNNDITKQPQQFKPSPPNHH